MKRKRMRTAALLLAGMTMMSAWSYVPRGSAWKEKKSAVVATPTPVSTPAPRSAGGVTVETKDGTQQRTSPKKELTVWNYTARVKLSDIDQYRILDFIDKDKNAVGKLDPRKDAKSTQLADSNWYQLGSISNWLKENVMYYTPSMSTAVSEDMAIEEAEVIEEEEAVLEAAPDSGVPTFSGTTVQVEGIDEADIVKTDGKYIYYLGKKGLVIVQAGEKPTQVAAVAPVAVGYRDLYISGNKLVIIVSAWDDAILRNAFSNVPTMAREESIFFVYDIRDAKKPVLERTVVVEGELDTTRLYNNTVYFVTRYWKHFPSLDRSVAETFPLYRDSALGEDIYALSINDMYMSLNEAESRSYSIMGAFHLGDAEPISPKAYPSSGFNKVYMSKNALYLMTETYQGEILPLAEAKIDTHPAEFTVMEGDTGNGTTTTFINRFDLTQHGMKFAKTGSAPGYMLNQYSMDEYDGYLRVATTNQDKQWVRHNNLYVLDAKTLAKKGAITDLAKNESIQSARFRGKTAYMVTYETIDPLFVIDLSDPLKPKVMGELKIPGFSTYLHPYGNQYLIGVGQDTKETYIKNDDGTETVTGAVQSGIKLSLFDISNPQKPTEVNKLVLGGPRTYSPALHDPKSIMFDMDKGVMAFPIAFDQQVKSGNKTVQEQWRGGIVVEFSPKGFEMGAKMKLDSYYEENNSRFVYIGNTLYYVTNDHLVAVDYTTYQIMDSIALHYLAVTK